MANSKLGPKVGSNGIFPNKKAGATRLLKGNLKFQEFLFGFFGFGSRSFPFANISFYFPGKVGGVGPLAVFTVKN